MKLSLDHLPASALALVELIGLPATLALVEEYGGQVFQMPKGRSKRGRALLDELAACIGRDAAQALSLRHGGNYFSVPSCKRAISAVRDAQLQARYDELLAAGSSSRAAANKLAREFRLNWTTVQRISKRAAPDLNNPDATADTQQLEMFA